MKKRKSEGEINFVETFGIWGLLAYLIGVVQGYIKGFFGEHKYARWAGEMLICTSVFAVVFIAAYIVVPLLPQFQKNAEMDAAIAKAAEEEPDLEAFVQTLVELGHEFSHPKSNVEPETEQLEEQEEQGEQEKQTEPLDDSVLEPSDVYAEKGSIAVFKAYHPRAKEYQWELYDAKTKSWGKAPQEAVSEFEDELQRKISSLELAADREQQVRCQLIIEGDSPISCEADLHILSGQISSISADEFNTDAGTYASAKDIPVKITYQDGSKESVTGLNGLYFLEQSESSKKDSTTTNGYMQETITTVRTASEYDYIDPGSKEGMLLYRKGNGESVDIPVNIMGVDQTAPQITELTIGDFEVSNVDKEVPVTVTIKAEDDVTPLRQLTYAFLPEGEEPQEEDWTEQSVFQTDITRNGIWTAYCRDVAGNIATKEQEIIAVDTKAPIVRLTLEKEMWCQGNVILVEASDNLSVEYRYLCKETGEDSGWIMESSKSVSRNGIWKIQVRDAVGNVTEKEITVDNIDTKAPVIRSIAEK